MVSGARELLAIRDPLDAELFVSEVLGTWWGCSLPDGDAEELIGEALVDYAGRSREPAALALLTGIRHLGTPEQARKAAAAARKLSGKGLRLPPWAATIDRVEPAECWVSSDVYGDQDSVIATFTRTTSANTQAEPEETGLHALVVLVDYNLGAMVKDAWCTSKVETLLERCRGQTRENPLMTLTSLDPAQARARLAAALQETDAATDPPVSKGFAGYHAFLRARLRALPEGGSLPPAPGFSDDRRAALAAEFLASQEAENLSDTAAAGRCADLIIEHGCAADLGRPLRVSPIKVDLFLLDWLPRKVMLRTDDREAMPHVLSAWVRWAGRKAEVPQEGVSATLDAVWEASRRFEETYGAPERLGLDSGTVERLVPDGDLEALPRRAFAVPLLTGHHDGVDLGRLDPASEQDRRMLVAAEHDTDAESDPRLHLGLHEVVATQLWEGDPPETWETARRLLDSGYERHDVLHMLMSAVNSVPHGELTSEDAGGGDTATRAALRAALARLPGSWEGDPPE